MLAYLRYPRIDKYYKAARLFLILLTTSYN